MTTRWDSRAIQDWKRSVKASREYVVTQKDVDRFLAGVSRGLAFTSGGDQVRPMSWSSPDIAPNSFHVAIRMGAFNLVRDDGYRADGLPNVRGELPPISFTGIAAGGSKVSFMRPFRVGARIRVERSSATIQRKSGRSGEFAVVTYQFAYTDSNGELLAREEYSRVLKGI